MFHITRKGRILWDTEDRGEALRMTRVFRDLERTFGTNRPITMDRAS